MRFPAEKTTAAAEVAQRALVIDDDALVARTISRVLGPSFEVQTASDGATALALLGEDARFDVIVCDIHMPGMNGAELHRTLFSTRPDLAPKMLFLTGDPASPHVASLLHETGARVLSKPFVIDDLRRAISALTGVGQGRRDAGRENGVL